jgi:hypothetical protein
MVIYALKLLIFLYRKQLQTKPLAANQNRLFTGGVFNLEIEAALIA